MTKRRGAWLLAGVVLMATLGWGAWKLRDLQRQVEARFQGQLFAVPARVYSSPLVLFAGIDVEEVGLVDRLHRLNYHPAREPIPEPGEYIVGDGEIEIGRRAFRDAYRQHPTRHIIVYLEDGSRVRTLRDRVGRELSTVEIEPELIAEFHGQSRETRQLLTLDEVPEQLVDAVLAIEDRRFFRHRGVHPSRIFGALVANLRAGRVVQGGSTLTQQLVKNFYLTAERTLGRKILEAIMALMLEHSHTKQEILQAYLNEVYMGQRGSVAIHGMGEASSYYFAKSVSELNLAESALLAGVIKGPAIYSPYLHPESARTRRDLVLQVLFESDRISEAAYQQAVESELRVRGYEPDDNPAPYFVEFLRQDLASVYGEEILQSEGLAVYTTLDPHAQRVANRSLVKGLERLERDFPKLQRDDSPLQGALVALLPSTGEVLALVGGRDYRKSQFNRATQAHRQPGSVFKPIVALAALASMDGEPPPFTLASILQDEPFTVKIPGGEWTPVNYDEEFHGEVSLREAIEQSLNVPVARLGLEVGPKRIIRAARRAGIRSPLEEVPSLALGAYEVTLLEIVRSYAVLAGGGMVPVLRSYSEVSTADGHLLDRKPIDFKRAFQPAEVFLVTSLLRGAVERGTAQGVRARGFRGDVAGKTGTTSGFRDAWFIGFTPDLLVGVWVGFDDGAGLGIPGAVAALPIFSDFLMGVRGVEGRARFDEPPNLERRVVPSPSEFALAVDCSGPAELFLPGTAPPSYCAPAREGSVFEDMVDWFRGQL